MTLKEKILGTLLESGDFVSGQRLCEEMSVSRTAVWKAVNALKKDGYIIHAVQNRGYKVETDKKPYSGTAISTYLKTKKIGQSLCFFEETDSTNEYIRRHEAEGLADGFLAVAASQTAGRGRRGRNWISDRDHGIYMSVLLRPKLAPHMASGMTLAAAVAVCRAMDILGCPGTSIKWPNDITAGGKKLAGILTETSSDEDRIRYCVIGIGINAGELQLPEDLKKIAVSIDELHGGPVDRARAVAVVAEELEKCYDSYMECGGLYGLQEEYTDRLANLNRQVRILSDTEETGICRGITKTGELLVELPDGSMKEVISGEVSVRGIYGYV